MKATKLSAQSTAYAAKKMTKPWIFLPLLAGILIILAVWLLILIKLDEASTNIRKPLVEADIAIREFIDLVNNFTTYVVVKAEDFIDEYKDEITSNAIEYINKGLNDVLSSINTVKDDFEQNLDEIVNVKMDQKYVFIPTWDYTTLGITIPETFVPDLPKIDTSSLLIPRNLLSLENSIMPWVDSQLNHVRNVALIILYIGLCVAGLPALAILIACCKPWVPHRANEFFTDPKFYDE